MAVAVRLKRLGSRFLEVDFVSYKDGAEIGLGAFRNGTSNHEFVPPPPEGGERVWLGDVEHENCSVCASEERGRES